jgi:hypothetical protein
MDPISAWLTGEGIDPMATIEALALVIFLVLLWGAALSCGRSR